jgi:hypothetical protein
MVGKRFWAVYNGCKPLWGCGLRVESAVVSGPRGRKFKSCHPDGPLTGVTSNSARDGKAGGSTCWHVCLRRKTGDCVRPRRPATSQVDKGANRTPTTT